MCAPSDCRLSLQVVFLDRKERLEERLREHELDKECVVSLTNRWVQQAVKSHGELDKECVVSLTKGGFNRQSKSHGQCQITEQLAQAGIDDTVNRICPV